MLLMSQVAECALSGRRYVPNTDQLTKTLRLTTEVSPSAVTPVGPATASIRGDRDPPRLSVGLLRNVQGQHPVLQVRLDARRIQLAAEREAAAVPRYSHFGVHRLQPLGRQRTHAPFDQKGVALDLQLQL